MYDTLLTVEGLKNFIYLKNTSADKREALISFGASLYTVAGRTHETRKMGKPFQALRHGKTEMNLSYI